MSLSPMTLTEHTGDKYRQTKTGKKREVRGNLIKDIKVMCLLCLKIYSISITVSTPLDSVPTT